MGTLKVNGIDILNYSTPISKGTAGTEHVISKKIKGISADVDSGTKKFVVGWELSNTSGYSNNSNYDAAKGRIKISGTTTPIMIDGTRPRNLEVKASITGTGLTYYLNNIDGALYLATEANAATGTTIISSKAPNKDCVVNIACWGAGGKGGYGGYWLLAGNWGGIGGAGAGKAYFTACIKQNDYIKIVTDSDSAKNGRITESNDGTFAAPDLNVYNSSGTAIITCCGGRSGVSNHPRWASDPLDGGGTVSFSTATKLPIIIRKVAKGGNKVTNGLTGNACTFSNQIAPNAGNPEGSLGSLTLTGNGGPGPDSGYNQAHGSGGGGSYGNGGNAGDTAGGSWGIVGVNGGGGGGGGSPSGGAVGENGGVPGFIIFY